MLHKEAGILRPLENALDVNIVPLFETIGDLENAAGVMERIFSMPTYRGLLAAQAGLALRPARQPRPEQTDALHPHAQSG